jgi:sugar phosphate isomerase/epimerase
MRDMQQNDDVILVGMTVATPRLDLEAAAAEIAEAGYRGVEVFSGQIGPGVFAVEAQAAHARVARGHLERRGLVPVTLNSIDGSFDPLRAPDSSIQTLARHLQLADALGVPRLLIWDGIHDETAVVAPREAPQLLAETIVAARNASGLRHLPAVSVELHPFTYTFQHGLLAETATALTSVGAGICLDVAHFGVALGAYFAGQLTGPVLDAVNHVHWCDSDCRTSGLHFPMGQGVVDLARLETAIAARPVVIALDLFGWPAPREAMREVRVAYAELLHRHRVTLDRVA